MATLEEVGRLLKSDAFRTTAAGFDRRAMIRRANAIGPQMRLLYWRRMDELGRLPAFDEHATDDAISGINRFGASAVEIFMISHRWLRSSLDPAVSHPDDPAGTKAKALGEFTRWRRNWVLRTHGFEPEIFYWVDYCCFDQRDVANHLPMLPLWVACCERLLRYETNDYQSRAWCRLELLLSYTFAFADHHVAIGSGFAAAETNDGREVSNALQKPSEGSVTDAADVERIAALERFASEFEPAAVDRTSGRRLPRAEFGQTVVKCYRL